MTLPASPAAETLTLSDRFHVLILDIVDQLGWEHDALALELHQTAGRLTGRAAAAVAPLLPEHRQAHRHEALRALETCRTLLEHVEVLAGLRTIRTVDPELVAGALRHLAAIGWLLDNDGTPPQPARLGTRLGTPRGPAVPTLG